MKNLIFILFVGFIFSPLFNSPICSHSVNTVKSVDEIQPIPMPTKQPCDIGMDSTSVLVEVSVVNILGKNQLPVEYYSENEVPNLGDITDTLGNLPDGIYLVKIGELTHKIIMPEPAGLKTNKENSLQNTDMLLAAQ